MALILRLAWRNLWRNKRRTLITLGAIAFNTAILIIDYGLMTGLIEHAVKSATDLVVGEAQIHEDTYLADRSLYKVVRNPDELVRFAAENNIGATKRSYGYGLVAHGTKSAGALFWGIDPAKEKVTFDLAKHLDQGDFLPDAPEKSLVLGKKLARSLNAKRGDEIVVVVQAADGSLGNELYTVRGVLKAAGEGIDRNAALLHAADFEEIFVSEGRVHEIALNSRGRVPLKNFKPLFAPILKGEELKTWRELLPILSDMMHVMDVALWIFGSIFFLVAALGVLNTMLMATYERIREFGILKAIGTSPARIVGEVAVEAFMLALVATAIGAVLGLAGAQWLKIHGIDTTRWAGETTIAGVAFDPIWRTSLHAEGVIFPVLVMWVVCVLASLYPALIAARLDPVKAIHHT